MKYVSDNNLNSFVNKLKIWIKNRKVKSSDMDSGSATNGQVLTANGSGGASYAAPSGISQSAADARYLKLSGGTLTGSLKVSYNGILDPQSNNLIALQSNNNWINVGSGGNGKVLRLHSGNENIKHIKSGDMYDILDTSMGLPFLTTAPDAANTDGIKIVVLSSEPATKYNGYLYIITA